MNLIKMALKYACYDAFTWNSFVDSNPRPGKGMNQRLTEGRDSLFMVNIEAIQTGAMAIRLLSNLE